MAAAVAVNKVQDDARLTSLTSNVAAGHEIPLFKVKLGAQLPGGGVVGIGGGGKGAAFQPYSLTAASNYKPLAGTDDRPLNFSSGGSRYHVMLNGYGATSATRKLCDDDDDAELIGGALGGGGIIGVSGVYAGGAGDGAGGARGGVIDLVGNLREGDGAGRQVGPGGDDMSASNDDGFT